MNTGGKRLKPLLEMITMMNPQAQQSPSDAAPIGMSCSRSRRRLLGRRQGKAGQDGSRSHDFCFGDTTFNPENEEPNVNPHFKYAGWGSDALRRRRNAFSLLQQNAD